MTNLDRAREAFERWASQYEATDHPERPCGGRELLEALHACGVSDHQKSMWRYRHHPGQVVELICFATMDGSTNLAVVRHGEENLCVPRPIFLKRYAPLGGD